MKKFIAPVLLCISILSFYIFYNNYKEEQIFVMKNVENHLSNSSKVIIPSSINNLPRGKQYEKIMTSAEGGKASLYFSRIDQHDDNEKIIKYVYIQDNEYMENFHIIEGRGLEKDDMDTNNYVSTRKSDDPNQVGVIASIGNMEMEIKTLHSMLDDGFLLDGECIISVSESSTIDEFQYLFNEGSTKLEVYEPKDIGYIVEEKYVQIAPLFLIIIILILYDLIKSYKKISIEKMLGFSCFDIWKKRISKIILMQLVTTLLAAIIMSLLLFKEINILHFNFYKQLFRDYALLIIITTLISTIPFIYIENINIVSIIKNKTNIKDIIVINKIVKIVLCVMLIALVNMQVINYDNIKSAFDNSFKQWDEVKQYRVLRLNGADAEMFMSKSFTEKQIEAYKEFNKKGALLCDFNAFTNESKSMNSDLNELAFTAVVNPNYLKVNEIYDVNNNKIKVSEDNKNAIFIVPDKYKDREKEVRDYYKYNSEFGNTDLEIIWSKSGQKLFSYNFNVNVDDGGYVEDPILNVIPENGSFPVYFTQMFNTTGNPIKIKVEDGLTDTETIMPVLDRLGLSSYGVQINYANEEVASTTKDYKDMFKWLVFGMISSLVIIFVIIVQNVQNFVEQNKTKLALKKLHGYSMKDKYSKYFLSIIFYWLIIMAISLITKVSNIKISLIITVIGIIVEGLISLLLLSYNENSKIIKYIKGGI